VAQDIPNPATDSNTALRTGIPGSGAPDHPSNGIPLPAHGFETLDLPVRELATIPAVEVISRAAVMLMSSAAEKLGLAPGEEPDIDLDEARRLITALAGLLASSQDYLGPHRQPLRDGLRTLQNAFREASVYPDAAGEGPGETLLS
jgi:Domain of unknown function (DUF1844)